MNKYRENIFCKVVKKNINPNALVFDLEYTPAPGQYILFGCKRKQDDYIEKDEADFQLWEPKRGKKSNKRQI